MQVWMCWSMAKEQWVEASTLAACVCVTKGIFMHHGILLKGFEAQAYLCTSRTGLCLDWTWQVLQNYVGSCRFLLIWASVSCSSTLRRAVPKLQWAGTYVLLWWGWPGQPDVPMLIITGTALWAKLHLGHLRKLQGISSVFLLDRLCNCISNQTQNLNFTFLEHLAIHVLGRLILEESWSEIGLRACVQAWQASAERLPRQWPWKSFSNSSEYLAFSPLLPQLQVSVR